MYDSDITAFYDYFIRADLIQLDKSLFENYEKYKTYLQKGISYSIFLEHVCILCPIPEIKRDSENRLHSENEPAIMFKDGYKLYFWHGVAVPEKLILHPEQITREDIIKESNAEVRRAMMEKLGNTRYAELLDLVVVDIQSLNSVNLKDWAKKIPGFIGDRLINMLNAGYDVREKEYVLLRTREKDELAGDYLQFFRCRDSSTERIYHIPVPPNLADALEAAAWTFWMDKETYNPEIET